MEIGARYRGDGQCEFTVWAPQRERVLLHLCGRGAGGVEMAAAERGYHYLKLNDIEPGERYLFGLDAELRRPDPASMWQPETVHTASAVVDHTAYRWRDRDWNGIALDDVVLYELHVGAFTPRRTFEAVVPRLDALREMGVTAIELMPLAQFPGARNWGYDGVYPFAVQHSYGGVNGLKRLVDECHTRGLAVILDVVYNHLGPEGNYLHDYGPYFTDKYHTPWGMAVNFDDEYADEVRSFFIQNALYWLSEFHIDGLRLDAVHAIYDQSAHPFLQELAEAVTAFSQHNGHRRLLIAESDLNDSRLIRARTEGGYGLDAQWCDDFHHALHTMLTGETNGYYQDYGSLEHLARAFQDGYVYTGQYSAFRKRRYGNRAADLGGNRFVVCTQNHDQVGNRMLGERLSALVDFESCKLAAAAMLLSPFVPLLFMGEEYGEARPFLYFVSHTDPDLVEAVRQGRRREFEQFHTDERQPPDAQDEATLAASTLDWEAREHGRGKALRALYTRLLHLRVTHPCLGARKEGLEVECEPQGRTLRLYRRSAQAAIAVVFNLAPTPCEVSFDTHTQWVRLLDTADTCWDGPGGRSPERLLAGERLTVQAHSGIIYQSGTDHKHQYTPGEPENHER